MSPKQALEEAHRAGVLGTFLVVLHARGRQEERNVQRADIQEGLKTATQAMLQDNDRWRLTGGHDLDGDDLTLIVVYEAGVVVITVF